LRVSSGLSPLQRRQQRLGWLFLTPALLILAALGFYPLLRTIWLSFTDAELASSVAPRMVGAANYVRLMRDAEFHGAIQHTLAFTLISVSLEMICGFAVAMLLNARLPWRGVLRALVLVPWALPTVVSAKVWNYMFVDTYGVINDLLVTRLGLLSTKIAYLAEPGLALGAVIAVDVWKTTPFVALLLLGGLQLIPPQLNEAAAVDGASPLRRMWHITLPMLMPMVFVTLVFRTLDALRVFDLIWVLTRGQSATESLATYNYRQMVDFRLLGQGSAVSVVILLIVAVFVIAYVALFRPGRSAEGE
jgi:trehalose/maltose transport system permease protein